jgi:hypothetical protein
MAKVLRITLLENCLDNSTVKQIELDTPLTESLMQAIAAHGNLKYYPHFPRPYFRIDRAYHYVIQGIMGNHTLRVTFSPSADESTESQLAALIEETPPESR